MENSYQWGWILRDKLGDVGAPSKSFRGRMIRHIVLFGIIGCWVLPTEVRAEPIVFIVSYHNVDYAKNVCDYVLAMQKSGNGLVDETTAGAAQCKSVSDTRLLGRQLENSVIDALAVEPLCGRVTVIRDPHPSYDGGISISNAQLRQKKPYWDLHIDLQPGSKVLGWTLFPDEPGMKSAGPLVNGQGTAPMAARQICIVVTGRGATIR